MSGKHTPGPWTYDGCNSITADFEGVGICILEPLEEFWCGDVARHPKGEEYEANARLIAAAPAMLNVLNILHVRLHREQNGNEKSKWTAPLRLIADVIRKATNKE